MGRALLISIHPEWAEKIFDKPKELSEFGLTKAPQKCVWVYIDEKPEPHQVSVLDEETPSEKDESERKPF